MNPVKKFLTLTLRCTSELYFYLYLNLFLYVFCLFFFNLLRMSPQEINISAEQMKQLEERLTKSLQLVVAATMKEEMKQLRAELELSKQVVKKLESDNVELTKQVNDLQQYIRRENVLITNYPEQPNENIEAILCQLGEKIGVPLNYKVDIQAAHRNPSKSAVKPIIVRFTNRQVRNAFIKAAKNKKLKLKNNNIYVNDHLSPSNSKLYYEARMLVRAKKLKASWTTAGKIFVKKSEDSQRVHIQHVDDLKTFQV